MAASRILEEDSGTYTARRERAHNGYYGGDFSGQPFRPLGSFPVYTVASRTALAG
jgi:hypothetical protein